MNDTQITLQGWLGGAVTSRRAGDATLATFRVASTPRHFSRTTQQWVAADTQWYTVKAWRGLAENCLASLGKGDPVVVHGRLEARPYLNGSGVEALDLEVEATFVGHDLNRGTSTFERAVRPERPTREGESDATGAGSTGPGVAQTDSADTQTGTRDATRSEARTIDQEAALAS